jgi:hypothetical protein
MAPSDISAARLAVRGVRRSPAGPRGSKERCRESSESVKSSYGTGAAGGNSRAGVCGDGLRIGWYVDHHGNEDDGAAAGHLRRDAVESAYYIAVRALSIGGSGRR